MKQWFRLFKIQLILLLTLCWLAWSLAQNRSSSRPALDINKGKSFTTISIIIPDGWDMKLLNDPPAVKLFLKVFSTTESSDIKWKKGPAIPEFTGIKDFRITRLNENTCLVVFEFTRALDYEWDKVQKNRLNIHDEAYYDKSEIAYFKGLSYQKKHQFNVALSYYRRAIFLNHKHGNAYFKAGQIRFALRQYHKAEINFKHALRLNCDSVKVYLEMSRLYRNKGVASLARKYEQIYHKKLQAEAPTPESETMEDTLSFVDLSDKEIPNVNQETTKHDTTTIAAATIPHSKIPLKIILYLAGILLSGGFLLLKLIMIFRSKNRQPGNSETKESKKFDQNLLDYLNNNSQSGSSPPEPKPSPATKNNSKSPLADLPPDSMLREEILVEDNLEDQNNFNAGFETDGSQLKEIELARDLNLGIGEIELALNLRAIKRKAGQDDSLENEIEQLYMDNPNTSKIARQMKMGQGEVELILAMRKAQEQSETIAG